MTPNDVSFKRMRNDVIYKVNHKGYKPRPETITKYSLVFDEEAGTLQIKMYGLILILLLIVLTFPVKY